MGYEIKEVPSVLVKPPVEPSDFTYGEIRNRIIAQGDDDNLINQKFVEISNRQASFNNMSTDEKLAEIANLIENLLKKSGKFITPDYPKICFDYISNDIVTSYRKKMHCFRHATDEAIAERNSYSEEQKNFFVDYGLTIVKVIHGVLV